MKIKKKQSFINYPILFVLFRSTLLFSIFLIGTFLMRLHGIAALVVYLVFTFILVILTLFFICRHCYYQGKICDLGVSVISSICSKKEYSVEKFKCNGNKSIIWYVLLVLAPLLSGATILVDSFSLSTTFVLMIYIVLLLIFVFTTVKFSCPHCKMIDDCPFVN